VKIVGCGFDFSVGDAGGDSDVLKVRRSLLLYVRMNLCHVENNFVTHVVYELCLIHNHC